MLAQKYEEINYLEKIVKDQERKYMLLNKEILMDKGLLSFRGILERVLKDAYLETRSWGASKFIPMNMCRRIMDTAYTPTEDAEVFYLLREWLADCGREIDLVKLYEELSKEIHGQQWSDEVVILRSKYFSKQEQCFLLKVAGFLHLDMVRSEN